MKKKRVEPASKSSVVTVRLEPRMRFALDLLARKRHRTMTSVVEWALARAIEDPDAGLFEADPTSGAKAAKSILDEVWDPEDSDRFVKLAMRHQGLLNFDEDRLWKAIREDQSLWLGRDKPAYASIRKVWSSLKSQYRVNW